jgi:RimJ/RimL family protein N-acetyltransferase
MDIAIKAVSAAEWLKLSEKAHSIVFGEFRPASKERFDYALIAIDPTDTLMGYITVRESDSDTAYWQFGGSFPSYRGSPYMFKAYAKAIEWSRGRYDRITTFIKNDNKPMLKFALHAGFKVVGVRAFKGNVLLEQSIEFQGE